MARDRAIENCIGKCNDGHTLMMGHIGFDDFVLLGLGNARWGEIDRFVKSVSAATAKFGEFVEILGCMIGRDHTGQTRGVRRNDEVLAQASFQSEFGNTETRILVGEFDIAGVECRLRHAPRRAIALAKTHLLAHGGARRCAEQTVGWRQRYDVWHQIFKHRSRPRDEHRCAANGNGGAAKAEPMARFKVAFGNCDEAGQARFRGQQIVATLVKPVCIDRIPDR